LGRVELEFGEKPEFKNGIYQLLHLDRYFKKFEISCQNWGGQNYSSKLCVKRRNSEIEGNAGFSNHQMCS